MSHSILCPLCQRKNKANASVCVHCGFDLTIKRTVSPTTIRVSGRPTQKFKDTPCEKYLPELPSQALALFFVDVVEPYIIHDAQQVIIGREDEDSQSHIDLTRFGAAEFGVSRHHARLSLNNGVCTLVDLHSTNGSWLNGRRLTPDTAYIVQPNDQIQLAGLLFTVCFHLAELSSPTTILLELPAKPDHSTPELTPAILAEYVAPYLHALADFQLLLAEYQEIPLQPIIIRHIEIENGSVGVKLAGGKETIDIIERWIKPWQQQYSQLLKNDPPDNPEINNKSVQLAGQILSAIFPDLRGIEKFEAVENFLPPLITLATSKLTFR